jgi:SulP family sulfate permease
MSAIEALKKLTEQYKNHNKKVVLRHLSADCVRLLENAGGFIEVNIEEDPVYNVMPE